MNVLRVTLFCSVLGTVPGEADRWKTSRTHLLDPRHLTIIEKLVSLSLLLFIISITNIFCSLLWITLSVRLFIEADRGTLI